ncbi:hypothetical protein Q8F55_005427 [Vanrija albida]|uniref:Uncharacterized protein n=1 Tax=Vanrija albida TaxID=181172 RepID=A0ABR3Q1L7_9TREE
MGDIEPSAELTIGLKAWAQTDELQWAGVGSGSALSPLERFPPPREPLVPALPSLGDPKPSGAYTERIVPLASLHALDDVVAALNASRLTKLDLSFSVPDPTGESSTTRPYYERLLSLLDARALRVLSITNPLESADVPALASFLAGPAARGLEWLRLSTSFTTADYDRLADGLRRNPSVSDLCLDRAQCTRFPPCACDQARDPSTSSGLAVNRVNALLRRNARYRERVRAAVRRVLPPARVLLTAMPRSGGAEFRLLDLPHELVVLVVRHASGDAGALSDAQWGRVIAYAEDPRSAGRAARGLASSAANGAGMRDARAEWLADGGFFWEHGAMREVPADSGRAEDDDEGWGNGVVRTGAVFFGW